MENSKLERSEFFVPIMRSLENTGVEGLGQSWYDSSISVIPAWSAGIQAEVDVSGRILRPWMPAIHAGMTKLCIFMFCGRA